MNFKEKWTKQNNSVKLLLKKLRRHDTFVVAIAVVLAMSLCAGLIYFSTPVVTATAREELEQSERENNEKTIEKLDELSVYLDGLDKSITEGKDGSLHIAFTFYRQAIKYVCVKEEWTHHTS